MAAIILTQVLYKKVDLTMALNGALGGLVAVTAEPLRRARRLPCSLGPLAACWWCCPCPCWISSASRRRGRRHSGALGRRHLGTIAVVFSNGDASLVTQIIGIVAIGAFVLVTTGIVWTIRK